MGWNRDGTPVVGVWIVVPCVWRLEVTGVGRGACYHWSRCWVNCRARTCGCRFCCRWTVVVTVVEQAAGNGIVVITGVDVIG